jgi:hypothetical protein
MAEIAIITAIYDDYDELKPTCPQAGLDVDWVCVTDNIELTKSENYLGWRIEYEPYVDVHPNRAAKIPKLWPYKYCDADMSIWVDASFRVVSPHFAREAIGCARPIAQFNHPWRQCVYDEAEASVGIPKYAGEPVEHQMSMSRSLGHPEQWGLWATGVIARIHTDQVCEFNDRWANFIASYSFQDQLSEPVALRLSGLRPVHFPGTHFSNKWLSYEGSTRH